MSLPSMTDASESKKKLQCARSRPSSASDRCPLWSRNSRNASQRWPDSCPITLSVLFSPRNFCVGIVRVLASQSITTMLRRRPALPKSAREIEDVDADALRSRSATVDSYANASRDERRVGPDHELVVVVGMRAVELLRQRDEVELRILPRTARRPRPAPPAVGPGSLRLTVRKWPVLPGRQRRRSRRAG